MKKGFILAAAALMAAGAMNAKTLDEVRIYLNPGHGSWGANDRPMATIPYPADSNGLPDTCGFYESNTNLWKILKLGNKLEQMGVKHENIMYSRVKNGPYPYVKGADDEALYNRSLSEICTEVEANNMDMFLSVHSNAATDGTSTNYPLYLYRGSDGEGNDLAVGSRDMAMAIWPGFYSNELDPMTYYSATNPNIRGDVSFYNSSSTRTDPNSGKTYEGYLGVLKHGAPGFLSEGYFHTYQPARHRALNPDYCGQEGVRYARGIGKYFGYEGEKIGYIMGTIKDLHEKMSNNLFKYNPGTNDQWVPINGAKVILYKGTEKVGEYLVDQNYNGLFVFEGLTPGADYSLDVEAEGYKALADEYKQPITVTADMTTYPMLYMESESYTPPTVVYYNYPDPVQDGYIGVADEYAVTATNVTFDTSMLDGKTIRKSIQRGDSIFVLALDSENAPYIYLINNKEANVKQLSTAGTQGVQLAISDIAFTSDNILVACNREETQFSADQVAEGASRGNFRVYKWNADFEGDPTEWFSSQLSGNFYNADTGNALAVSGSSDQCKIITAAVTTGSSRKMRFLIFGIENGALATSIRNQDNAYTCVAVGEDYQLAVSPRDDDNFIINGSNTTPIEFTLAGDAQAPTLMGQMSEDLISKTDAGIGYFKYAKHDIMVVPNATSVANLFDITNGIDKAQAIKLTGVDVVSSAKTETGVTTFPVSANAIVNNADILIRSFVNGKCTELSTENVAQPSVKAIFAYGLGVTKAEDSYKFSFNANSDAVTAAIEFYDNATGDVVGQVDLTDIKEGANEAVVKASDLPGEAGEVLNWGIVLEGKRIGNIAKINNDNSAYTRAFSIVDKCPSSPFFGRIYVTDRVAASSAKNGLYAYNADWTRINSTPYTGGQTFGSNYRIGIDSNGKVYIPDWSDPHSGIFVFDPANPEGEITQLFEGTRNSAGLFQNGGANVGGSTPGVFVYGEGENTVLYSYSEDLDPANCIAAYNIGSESGIASSWGEAPSFTITTAARYQANTNGNIYADGNGVWIAQTRTSGNNTAGVPSLMYVKNDGTIAFNSGTSEFQELLNGSMGSGFAVSKDNSVLVINDASSKFQFFDISWASDGTPSLTAKYSYKHSVGDSGNNIYQMAFDYAGNLVVSGASLAIFSIPTDNNTSVVPALKSATVVCQASGVGEISSEAVKLSVYPNPTTGIINITAPEEISTVKVYNANGALVAESATETVDLSGLSAGFYFVKVNNLKAVSLIKK